MASAKTRKPDPGPSGPKALSAILLPPEMVEVEGREKPLMLQFTAEQRLAELQEQGAALQGILDGLRNVEAPGEAQHD